MKQELLLDSFSMKLGVSDWFPLARDEMQQQNRVLSLSLGLNAA